MSSPWVEIDHLENLRYYQRKGETETITSEGGDDRGVEEE